MSRTVFFDLREKELSAYYFGNNGRSGQPLETVTFPMDNEFCFPPSDSFSDALESYLSLPLSLLNFRIIELPFSDKKKIKEIIPLEIEGLILSPPESIVYDSYVLGERNGRFRILIAYVLKDTLGKILEGLRAAGFDPRAVTSVELTEILQTAHSEDALAGLLTAPPEMASSVRIARAAGEIKNPSFNFRTGELAYTADTEKTRRSLKMTALLFLLLFVVLFADLALTLISVSRQNAAEKDGIRKTYQALFPDEKKISDEVYQLRAHLKEMKDKESSFVGASPLQVLTDLSRSSRPGISLNEITVDTELIVIRGECPSLSDAQKIKNDLEAVFRDVNISDTKASAQNKTLFTITAKGRKS
ncbi:MAG: hypothetical protein HZA17_04955 [Nitrospirae bacterium]|nr:hypothetical protein [Nitrospirota bacterium]